METCRFVRGSLQDCLAVSTPECGIQGLQVHPFPSTQLVARWPGQACEALSSGPHDRGQLQDSETWRMCAWEAGNKVQTPAKPHSLCGSVQCFRDPESQCPRAQRDWKRHPLAGTDTLTVHRKEEAAAAPQINITASSKAFSSPHTTTNTKFSGCFQIHLLPKFWLMAEGSQKLTDTLLPAKP